MEMLKRWRRQDVLHPRPRYCPKIHLFYQYPKHIFRKIIIWTKSRQLKVTILLCLMLILYLHFRILPRSMGYYNDSCYLSPKETNDMKFLLTRMTDAFNKENVTYWLDYGTLMGVWRTGEILKYDGDIDIARLFTGIEEDSVMMSRVQKQLYIYNISVNEFRAKYNGKTADLLRLKVYNKTKNIKVLKIWYPFVEQFGVVERIVNYFLPREVPYDLLLPTREKTVYGVKMRIPNKPLDALKRHYPLTWFISFPYKWKCWF